MKDRLYSYLSSNGIKSVLTPRKDSTFELRLRKPLPMNKVDYIAGKLQQFQRTSIQDGRFLVKYDAANDRFHLEGQIVIKSIDALPKVWFSFAKRLVSLFRGDNNRWQQNQIFRDGWK